MKAVLAVAFCAMLAACASSPDGSSGSGDPYVVTQEQIAATGEINLFEVVQRLRPEWLPSGRRPHTNRILYTKPD